MKEDHYLLLFSECCSHCCELQTWIWPSWCHCHSLSLALVKSRLVLPFWYRPTQVVLDKGPLNGCVCVCSHCRFQPYDCIINRFVERRHQHSHRLPVNLVNHPSQTRELMTESVSRMSRIPVKSRIPDKQATESYGTGISKQLIHLLTQMID